MPRREFIARDKQGAGILDAHALLSFPPLTEFSTLEHVTEHEAAESLTGIETTYSDWAEKLYVISQRSKK